MAAEALRVSALTQFLNSRNELSVVGGNRTTVTISSEVFSGVEAEGGGVPPCPRAPDAEPRPACLRRTLDDREAAPGGELADGLHVCYQPVEVNGDNGACARRECALKCGRGQQVGFRVYICED